MVTCPHSGCENINVVKLPFELVTEEPTSEQRLIKNTDVKLAEPDKNMQSAGATKLGPRTVCRRRLRFGVAIKSF